jgi:acyl carrier protein
LSTTTDIAQVARAEMREFIQANFLYMRPDLELRDEDDLLNLGVIDSIGFVELVGEVEERYGLTIADDEIVEENFGSVNAIAAFVAAKSEEAV